MDWIIINARARTFWPQCPLAEAVAISGNRIARVGSNDEIRTLATKKTRITDAAGRLLLPGFNDAHVHFLDGGFSLGNISLRDCGSPAELAHRVGDYAQALPAGTWITGGQWDHERWHGAPLPTRNLIDKFTPSHPVFISRLDGHMALANSLALRLAGIGRDTRDPCGGAIVRDEGGEPAGVLKDAAMELVFRIIPKPDAQQKRAAARRATDYAARLGVTSVQDVLAGDDTEIYRGLETAGELKTRVYAMYPIAQRERVRRADSSLVRTGAVKGFSDGSLGSRTAWFFEPMADDPGNCGLPGELMIPPAVMRQCVLAADRAGLQVALHAIGDRANAEVLDLFAAVANANGPRDRRFRIEHAQHLRTQDIPRFGPQQVIASVQPYHAADDGRWCATRLGASRLAGTYAFRSLLEAGTILALGTDWTVAPLDPLLTLEAAVTRRTLDGMNPEGWLPGEKLTMDQAVRAYTGGSAFAEFAEGEKGLIAPGLLADLILLDADIFETGEPARTRNTWTMMGGKEVWSL